jgi:hypothetical protein
MKCPLAFSRELRPSGGCPDGSDGYHKVNLAHKTTGARKRARHTIIQDLSVSKLD